MNVVIITVAVTVLVGAVIIWAVAYFTRKAIAEANITAGLKSDDLREMAEMKALFNVMRQEYTSGREAQAQREGRIEKQIEGLGRRAEELGDKTRNLEGALRGDAQAMGNWSEMQLRRVLEISGVTEHICQTYQDAFAGDGSFRKNLRTDVQIRLPNGKIVVIDSKATVPAYMDLKNATNDDERKACCDRIIKSVQEHMSEIKRKQYEKQIPNCYERVIMYIGIEEVYLLACKAKVGDDKRLLREVAMENGIVFANAFNLLPVLDGIAMLWADAKFEDEKKNFIDQADKLCQKAKTFLESYKMMGTQLASLVKTYKTGMGQLAEGKANLVKQLGELSELKVPEAARLPGDEELVEHAGKVASPES